MVTHNNLTENNVKIVVPLRYFSNFWRNLNIPLISCEVEKDLPWFKNCVLIDKITIHADALIDRETDNPEMQYFK